MFFMIRFQFNFQSFKILNLDYEHYSPCSIVIYIHIVISSVVWKFAKWYHTSIFWSIPWCFEKELTWVVIEKIINHGKFFSFNSISLRAFSYSYIVTCKCVNKCNDSICHGNQKQKWYHFHLPWPKQSDAWLWKK